MTRLIKLSLLTEVNSDSFISLVIYLYTDRSSSTSAVLERRLPAVYIELGHWGDYTEIIWQCW